LQTNEVIKVAADVATCFEAISPSQLMSAIEERIVDRHLLELLRAMLRAGVTEDRAIHAQRRWNSASQGGLAVPVQRLSAPA
jgi:hypothetical protein